MEEIRKKTLQMHEKYMNVKPHQYYSEMSREEVTRQLKNLNEYNEEDGLTKCDTNVTQKLKIQVNQ